MNHSSCILVVFETKIVVIYLFYRMMTVTSLHQSHIISDLAIPTSVLYQQKRFMRGHSKSSLAGTIFKCTILIGQKKTLTIEIPSLWGLYVVNETFSKFKGIEDMCLCRDLYWWPVMKYTFQNQDNKWTEAKVDQVEQNIQCN